MITLTDDNRAEIPVEVPSGHSSGYSSGYGGLSGLRVRVELAMSEEEPGEMSPRWFLAGIVRTSQTITTEPLPPRARFWVRGRTEGAGRRPSAWTTPESFDTAADAGLFGITAAVGQAGQVTLSWRGNPETRGLLVEYSVVAVGNTPSYSNTIELDALDPYKSGYSSGYSSGYGAKIPWRSRVLSGVTVGANQAFYARVTPYNDYSGGVAGDAGLRVKVADFKRGAPQGSGYSSGYSGGYGSA